MQFPPSFLDEIRNRLLTSQVVGKKVQLKSNGREFGGLCPFHKEKTPSFTVNDEKAFYHCFGCNAHGDIVKFVMETEGLPFVEAVKNLATDAGLQLPKMDEKYEEKQKQAQSLYEVMEEACRYFQNQLTDTKGSEATAYLNKRGLQQSSIDKFRIGFAPNGRNGLKQYLATKGITEKQMLDVGLLVKNDRGEIYDKFRGRVMFPIINIKNQVIAFGGRILGDGQPKYLNSPETILFKKGDILYNENNARALAFKTGKIVVTEGYMDVIAMDAVGIKTAIAPLGTAITENQIRRLWRMATEPVICLDGDAAGKRAMDRAAHLCLPMLEPGYTLKFAILPAGQDPDDFIKKMGVEQMRKILQNAKALSEILWQDESSKKDVATPEKKAELEKRLNTLSGKIQNEAVARYYRDFFKSKLWDFYKIDYRNKKPTGKLTDIQHIPNFNIKTIAGCESALVFLIINFPSLLKNHEVYEYFASDSLHFSSEKLDKIRESILQLLAAENDISQKDIRTHLENDGFSNDITYLDSLRRYFLIDNISENNTLHQWNYYVTLYNLINTKTECNQLELQMTEQSEKIVTEFRKQIANLEKDISRYETSTE